MISTLCIEAIIYVLPAGLVVLVSATRQTT